MNTPYIEMLKYYGDAKLFILDTGDKIVFLTQDAIGELTCHTKYKEAVEKYYDNAEAVKIKRCQKEA